jgi:hypothetical protein
VAQSTSTGVKATHANDASGGENGGDDEDDMYTDGEKDKEHTTAANATNMSSNHPEQGPSQEDDKYLIKQEDDDLAVVKKEEDDAAEAAILLNRLPPQPRGLDGALTKQEDAVAEAWLATQFPGHDKRSTKKEEEVDLAPSAILANRSGSNQQGPELCGEDESSIKKEEDDSKGVVGQQPVGLHGAPLKRRWRPEDDVEGNGRNTSVVRTGTRSQRLPTSSPNKKFRAR